MSHPKINNCIIKIVGLLGVYDNTSRVDFQKKLLKNNKYSEDHRPEVVKISDTFSLDPAALLKDQYYPEFRDIMYFKSKANKELLCRRFICKQKQNVSLVNKKGGIINQLPVIIKQCEIYLFTDQISLFSLQIEVNQSDWNFDFLSDLILKCRSFDSNVDEMSGGKNKAWHEWISENYLQNEKLRGEKVKADEFSGSKFKVFTAIDCDLQAGNFDKYLYDLGTSSPLKSADGQGDYIPHKDYFSLLMKSKVSYFNNWEALCLFDSFTAIGSKFLSSQGNIDTWSYTYFRIYLFQLFFKYNLYRYNSDLHDNTVKLRNQFEKFLNNYNLSHISFNFLPNEMFNKIGEALHLDEELNTFQNRINRISSAIQEEKQSRTNALLQFVSVLGGLGSVKPVFDGLSLAQKYLGWSNLVFYTLLVLILLSIGLGLLAFLMPELVKKIKKKIFINKSDL